MVKRLQMMIHLALPHGDGEDGFFLIFFIVALLILLFSTAKVNRRRRIMGQAPIRGTAWLTPPTYRQSERDYNGTQRCVEDYVSEYTETANENDLGFYDERGEFHPNGKTEYLQRHRLYQKNKLARLIKTYSAQWLPSYEFLVKVNSTSIC